ncbi:MAG: TIGR04255 family protein, partial [Candidatus Korobacteraceae bacterium]
MKRTSASIHLKHPPLIYVVAQVLFTEVVAIEKFVPDIQESLRHKGFPRFLRGQVQEIAFQPDGIPKFGARDRFEFQNKEGSLGIVLQTKSVAIQTNSYSTYEIFEDQIRTAL